MSRYSEYSGFTIRFAGMMLFGNGSRMNRFGLLGSRCTRQRIVNLVLRRVRQREQVREIAGQMLVVRRDRARALVLPGNEVVDVRVIREEEHLPAVDESRNDERAAKRPGRVVRAARVVQLLAPCP